MKKTTILAGLPLLLLAGVVLFLERESLAAHRDRVPATIELAPLPAEAGTKEVHQFCGACHAYPPPDTFPRAAWRKEIARGYDFWRKSGLAFDYPSLESVVQYYEKRAPEELALDVPEASTRPLPFTPGMTGYRPPDQSGPPAVANVNLVHLFDKKRLDILVCDMRADRVMVLQPYEPTPTWKTLAHVAAPAHAEVVDLDGDGIADVVVASLGSFTPTDGRVGSVVWLRGGKDGSFTPITLLDNVGRVADVQAADFNGDGKLDLVVAAFGWRTTGEVIYLENRTTDWAKPTFAPEVVDNRHGAIHVPVCDLNNDGRPDFVALISQEHETIVAYLNEGKGKFRKEIIYEAPHPAYGSSGIQLVDFNGDGKLDVLYSNGDVMDSPYLLKPYHSIQWLENRGKFPFEHHHIATMYGVERAVAADIAGSGRLDIVGVSWLPQSEFAQRYEKRLDSIVLFEQATPGKFERHVLETSICDHVTCAIGDLYGDGHKQLVVGNIFLTGGTAQNDAVQIWKLKAP